MTYAFNSQIDTSGDASLVVNANDAAIAEVVWGEAHALYLKLRTVGGLDFDAVAFDRAWSIHRNAGKSSPAAARAALAFYQAIIAKAAADDVARVEARAEAMVGGPSLAVRNARHGYAAGAILKPFWAAGADLAGMAATIAATVPTAPHAKNSHQGLIPIGDDTDLLATLDATEAGLARVAAQLASIRADIKARAKVAK